MLRNGNSERQSIVLQFLRDESGATAMEYALIIALMSLAIIACLSVYGPALLGAFNRMGADMASPPNVTGGA